MLDKFKINDLVSNDSNVKEKRLKMIFAVGGGFVAVSSQFLIVHHEYN